MNQVVKAVEIYNEMLEAGIKPSLITYTSILQILIKSKKIQNAIDIFDEILANELSPDQVMYNVIINGCIFNGRLPEACKFLTKSFAANIRLCGDVYRNILNNLLTNRIMDFNTKVDITMKICKELKSRGLKIEYDLYYSVMKMIYKSNGKKADSFAQKETDEYKSQIEGSEIQKPVYQNNKKIYNYNQDYNNSSIYSDRNIESTNQGSKYYSSTNYNSNKGNWRKNN